MFEKIVEYYKGLFIGQGFWYIFGQVLGIITVFIGFLTYIQKTRKNILKVKILTDAISVPQNFLLNATSGGILCAIAVFRGIVFYYKGEKKWASFKFWLYIFAALMLFSPFISGQGLLGFLPGIGSVLAVFGFYNSNPQVTRLLAGLGTVLWLIYAVIMGNIGSTINSAITIVSVVIGLIKGVINKKNESNGTVSANQVQ